MSSCCLGRILPSMRTRGQTIHRAEEYRLKAERLQAKLKKAKEDAEEQLRQKDREIAEQN